MKVLLLCVVLTCTGCGLIEKARDWAGGDSDGDGISNAEEAARTAETAGGLGGMVWPVAGTLGAGIALFLRSLAKKKEETA